jgi:hypothetical protein
MAEMTESEEWMQACADEHGYAATFEPDWQQLFGQAFTTNPDFLLERAGARAVVEVRSFTSWALSDYLAKIGGGGAVPQAVTRRPIYYAIKEKAEQLEPFASTGVPLVVALTNPGGSDVILDQQHLYASMFGDVQISIPVALKGRDPASLPPPSTTIDPGYGAFCATKQDGTPYNPRPHVSAVVVVIRRDRYAAWRYADRDRFIEEVGGPVAQDDYDERIARNSAWLKTPVGRHEVDGPTGYDFQVSFYDLNRYALGHGLPLPEGWFNGPRDRHYAFDGGGTSFGPVER